MNLGFFLLCLLNKKATVVTDIGILKEKYHCEHLELQHLYFILVTNSAKLVVSVQNTGSQLRNFAPKGHLSMSRDICHSHSLMEESMAQCRESEQKPLSSTG